MKKDEIIKIFTEERTKFRMRHPDIKFELMFSTSIRDEFIIPFVEKCLQSKEQSEKRNDNFRCPVCNSIDTIQYTKTDNKCNYCRTIFDINKL